jgi:hypothetical protein
VDRISNLSLSRPLTTSQRDVVLDHLEHLLASPRFSTSKRYSSFLRYVVNQAADGNIHELKERSLGIEVFGRDPSYDTNADPTVRVTASEVRKKLAQYYYEHSDTGDVRIDLPLGSYVPEFHFSPSHLKPASASNPVNANTKPDPVVPASVDVPLVSLAANPPETPRQRRRWIPWTVAFGVSLLIALCVISWLRRPSPSAMDLFWAPVVNSPTNILICMGQFRSLRADFDPNGYTSRPGSQSQIAGDHDIAGTFWAQAPGDSIAEARVAGVLQSTRKRIIIRGESSTTFEDLRLVPSVLIGAFNNNWTIRATDQMRFRFQLDTKSGDWWIEDTATPGKRIGLSSAEQMAQRGRADTTDYAIIARQYDTETRQPTVVIAGLNIYGTVAAGEFATTPQYMEELAKHAPRDWFRKNMEIVVAVDVVTGTASAPRVVESFFW